jgi:hypothetical protein
MLSKNQLAPSMQKEIVSFQKSVSHVAPKLEHKFYFQKSIRCRTRQLFLSKKNTGFVTAFTATAMKNLISKLIDGDRMATS